MLTRHDPFQDLFRLQDELGRFFGAGNGHRLDATRATAWVPLVDVYEDPERLTFKMDLPDVKKEDLAIRVENNVLTIEGSRKLELDEHKENYHRVERSYGSFARSFAVPSTVATDKVAAELKEGVLRVTLPKKKEAQPRSIEIKAS